MGFIAQNCPAWGAAFIAAMFIMLSFGATSFFKTVFLDENTTSENEKEGKALADAFLTVGLYGSSGIAAISAIMFVISVVIKLTS